MKNNLLNCKVCGFSLKKSGQTVFCKCGWHASVNHKKIAQLDKKVIKGIVIASFALMLGVAYLGYWGSHSLSIIPLKAAQWTGSLDKASFAKLKNICMHLKKYDCVEGAYTSFYNSSSDLQVLGELGEFQYRRKDFQSAAQTYQVYFKNAGRDVTAAYNFARLLEKYNNTSDAEKYYKFALVSRPGVIQITVMRAYVDLLVKTGQIRKAKRELFEFKPLLKRAGALVHQEYSRWQKQVNG